MKTEPLFIPQRQAIDENISAALVSQVPTRVLITNERGVEANLTLAGYELSYGSTYEIRASGPVKEMRLVGYPNFFVRPIKTETDLSHKHNVPYRVVPIRVGPQGYWNRFWHHLTYPRSVEIEIVTEDGKRHVVEIPVIFHINRTLRLVVFLVLFALFTSVPNIVYNAVQKEEYYSLLTPWPWIRGLLLAFTYPITTFALRFWTRYRRARELEKRFLESCGESWTHGRSWK